MEAVIKQGILVERSRISSIDIARGLVMVIMAIDHSRHFFDGDSLVYEPTDLSRTTPFLFFTRWITHFCAPSFVLLAGTAIRLSMRNRTRKSQSIFLVTRGLWLIFLEVVVIRFLVVFNMYFDFTILQVIYAIGAAMILMSLVIWFSEGVILALSLVIIFGHDLVNAVNIPPESIWYIPSVLLLKVGRIGIGPDSAMVVPYPAIPWLGIMMLGYVLGKWFSRDYNAVRSMYLLCAGLAMVLIFIVVRYSNFYGDAVPWSTQKDFTYTVLSFLNCQKYPPSLMFTMMTIGPLLIFLSVLERVNTSFLQPLEVYGRVPMLYYILHFLLLHTGGLIYYMIHTGKSFSEIDFHNNASFGGITPELGHSLLAVYTAWLVVVIILYPVCAWYSNLKKKEYRWWFSYV